jgi:lipopolysaccharide assembly protein A
MKRGILLGFAALVALVGIIFSAINAESAELDFYFGSLSLPLGVLVLLSLLTGFMLGGLVLWAGVVLPLRLRLRQANRQIATAQTAPPVVEALPSRR